MKTNRIGVVPSRSAHIERDPTIGSLDSSRDKIVRQDAARPFLLSSLIAQDKIAKEFVRMDSAADPLVQESLQDSGPAVDEVAPRNEFEEQKKNESLKAIVHDDTKWNFFVQSVSLKSPQSEDVQSTRKQLIKGFESGDWSQVKNDPLFDELTQKQTPESRNARDLNGEGKRMDLWLENSDFFKQLFTAVQDGDLFSRPHLITDNRLIDFVLSLPDDAE